MWGKVARWLVTVGVGCTIWLTPVPEGLSAQAWHLLAIFVATVTGIIVSPLPMGAVALLGIVCTAVTGTLTIFSRAIPLMSARCTYRF